MAQERLQKLLAQAGVASRRASETLIEQGRVTVNGVPAGVGDKADPAQDVIRLDGEILKFEKVNYVYIMLNKPAGIVSAASAQRQEERRTVLDLVQVEERVYPVGRLDAESEGLLLLTNDGDLTQRLTHPSFGHLKTYRVLVKGFPAQEKLDQWAKGVLLDDGMTAPCEVTVDKKLEAATWLEIKMSEGRKRQIRRTAAALNLYVMRLIRTHFGPLRLSGVAPGEWRHLEPDEVELLKQAAPRRRSRARAAGSAKPAPGTSGARKPGSRPGETDRSRKSERGPKPGSGERPRRPRIDRPGGPKGRKRN
jgi:23S rRNA pseudouridine2605 synthase